MKSLKNKKFLGALALGAFFVTGFYNAIVLNSVSSLSSGTFVKRLDEVYGITTQGREVASKVTWTKMTKESTTSVVTNAEKKVAQDSSVEITAAAIQEDLTLNLIEVINPSKWQQGLNTAQFNGSLTANNGVIESLNVALPDGQGMSISFTEMNGNVFEYELNGQAFSGMMYQVDANSFMVSLTNGPLEGTRMRFGGQPSLENQQQMESTLAENHQIEVGTFGDTEMATFDSEAPAQTFQATGFNFDQATI